MIDNCNREIKHIRFSVTSDCDYNCIFCDHEGFIPKKNNLSVEEITNLCYVLAKILNVKRIKFTGGEPLYRRDIVQIIRNVYNLHLYEDISLTTNGYYLFEKAEELKIAGLNRLNVNFCSLQPRIYKKITGSDSLNKVLNGLEKAKEVGLTPIKLNCVVLKGINDNEIDDLIEFCSTTGYVLQLIQLHNFSNAIGKQQDIFKKYFLDIQDITENLKSKAVEYFNRKDMQNRRVFSLPNNVIVEIVRPNHEFCMGCTKLRVSSDGCLFGCLFCSVLGENLKEDLLTPAPLSKYEAIIKKVVESREPYF